MRRKTHRMIVLVLIVVMVIARVSGVASAKTSYVISGDRNGLEIRVPQKTVDTGNLNPGDKKSSSLQLLNTGSSVLNVYIRTNILGETSPRGGRLADVMTLTIKAEDELISDGTFREVAKEGYVLIGSIAPETTKTIYFSADFPEDAGNDYQGASLRVNWTFLTESVGGGGTITATMMTMMATMAKKSRRLKWKRNLFLEGNQLFPMSLFRFQQSRISLS